MPQLHNSPSRPEPIKKQSSEKRPQHVPSKQAQDAMRELGSKSPEDTSAELSSRLANGDLKVEECGDVLSTLKPDAAAMAAKSMIASLEPDKAGR